MIVCSCNVITDHQIRGVYVGADYEPRTPSEVYRCLGCKPECGRCARTIRTIIRECIGECSGADGEPCDVCPDRLMAAE
jgi:bacterioferritin-associated ferredoxin